MAYTRQQRKIQRAIIDVGRQMGMPRKAILSALATGAVESNFREPGEAASDLDSAGWRQERRSSYPGANRMDERAAARRYYQEWRADAPKGASIGAQAQAVQQSAFPGRYQQRAGEARRILRSFRGGSRLARGPGGQLRPNRAGGYGQVSVTPPTTSRGQAPGGAGPDLVGMLADSLAQKPVIQSQGLQAPEFAAGPAFPGGYQPVQASPVVVDDSLDDALQALGTLQGAAPPRSTVTPGQVQSLVGPARARSGRGRSALKGNEALFDVQKDGWKGARSVGIGLVRVAAKGGLESTSEKRSTVSTASGNVSDHYVGNKDSYAWDMVGSTQELDRMARKLARKLGKKWSGGSWLNVTKKIDGRTYRFQLGWRVPDHAPNDNPHIHMGVDRVDIPG